jgi:hypothetical protein
MAFPERVPAGSSGKTMMPWVHDPSCRCRPARESWPAGMAGRRRMNASTLRSASRARSPGRTSRAHVESGRGGCGEPSGIRFVSTGHAVQRRLNGTIPPVHRCTEHARDDVSRCRPASGDVRHPEYESAHLVAPELVAVKCPRFVCLQASALSARCRHPPRSADVGPVLGQRLLVRVEQGVRGASAVACRERSAGGSS